MDPLTRRQRVAYAVGILLALAILAVGLTWELHHQSPVPADWPECTPGEECYEPTWVTR